MLELKALLGRWEKLCYWSPEHPSQITTQQDGKTIGLGLVACRNFAAFNFAWAVTKGSYSERDWHVSAVQSFLKIEPITNLEVKGGRLGDYLTDRTEQEFCSWYRSNRDLLPPQCKLFDSLVPNELFKLPRI